MISHVEPTEQYFSLNWRIGTRCNYDCMYCPTAWHDSTSDQHSLEKLQQAWTSIVSKTQHHKLPYKILFTGGEVTVNKNFLPFVNWLQENYHNRIFKIVVTTNGSASTNYYLKMFKLVDNISFSLHSEHINEQEFFQKMIAIKTNITPDKFMHVNIMDEFWNQDRFALYIQVLEQNGISYNINKIDYSMQTRSIPIIRGESNLAI